MTQSKNEKTVWNETSQMLQNYRLKLGAHWSFNLRNDPKRFGFVLSRYKFAAKLACRKQGTVLELGCSEGIGATIIGELASQYKGIDLDEPAIQTAKENLGDPKYSFIFDDFMGKSYGKFDSVISLDVVEHILPEYEKMYFDTVYQNLSDDGICVIGTPNITAEPYASKASKLGHVNLYSQERLVSLMKKYFYQVFSFGMNDEIAHTGFGSMCHYLFAVGFNKKGEQ